MIRKITKRLVDVQKDAILKEIEPAPQSPSGAAHAPKANTDWKPLEVSVEDELAEAGEEEMESLKRKERQRELINSLDLKQ